MKIISLLLDILIPRFVTDYYAVSIADDGDTETLYKLEVFPDIFDDDFNGVIEVRCFNFFGFGLFNRLYLWVEDE